MPLPPKTPPSTQKCVWRLSVSLKVNYSTDLRHSLCLNSNGMMNSFSFTAPLSALVSGTDLYGMLSFGVQLPVREDIQRGPGRESGDHRHGAGADGNVCGRETSPGHPPSPGLRGEGSG